MSSSLHPKRPKPPAAEIDEHSQAPEIESPTRRKWVRIAICYVAVVIALACVYCSNLRLIAAGDSFPTALVTVSLSVDGTTSLDKFAPWVRTTIPWSRGLIIRGRDGKYHSVYPIGQALLAVPFVVPVTTLLNVDEWEVPRQVFFARVAEKVVSALLAAIAALVMYFVLALLVERKWAIILAAVFAFGTSCWAISSQALWQQTGGQLCITLSLYFWMRWLRDDQNIRVLALAGCACAFAVLIRPTNLVFTASYFLVIVFWHRRMVNIAVFLATPALFTSAVAAHNAALFGDVLGGYGQFATLSSEPLSAFAGILTSPGRGIFFFSPVLLFALFPLAQRSAWTGKDRSLVLACIAAIGAHLVVIALWPIWWGGFTWGWRLLTEIGPFFVVLVALSVPIIRTRAAWMAAFTALALFSVSVQAVGVYCYPGGGWDSSPSLVDSHRVWDWADNPIVRTTSAGLDMQPYVGLSKLRHAEAWTLKHTWSQIPPEFIAALQWWAFPRSNSVTTTYETSRQRRQTRSCHLDTVNWRTAETGGPLFLDLVGWSYDDRSNTAPDQVAVEILQPGRPARIIPATRWRRPDLVTAFQNPRLEMGGISATVLLDQPFALRPQVKVLQNTSDGVVECVPTTPVTAPQ